MISVLHLFLLSFIILILGILCMIMKRRNIMHLFIGIEIMLLALNIAFVSVGIFLNDILGQIIGVVLICVGAAEVSVGLSILVAYVNVKKSTNLMSNEFDELRD
ncbi:NADH-quinone oxidoreductase subunit NuoK [Candidatus Fokinia crypta]|nr:NADH-quinone oxidoreductase subunit NuoK [Candidatus Fokinia cryptica]